MRTLVFLLSTLAAAGVVAACGPEPSSSVVRVAHPSQLAGGAWRLVALNGRVPAPGPDVTLEFTGDRVGGIAPCNSFGGGYTYDPSTGALRLDELISTKRACVIGPRNDLEAAYFDALRTVSEADVDPDGRLVLVNAGGSMIFEVGGVPVAPPPSAQDPGPT